MSATDAQGSQARFCVKAGAAPHDFSSGAEPYDPLYESLQKRGRILGGNTLRGTREQAQERTRLGAYPVGGSFAFNPSPADFVNWLPRMLGAAASGTTFALSDTLPSFGILVDRVTQTYQYKNCMVNRWMLHGRASPGDSDPDLLELVIDVVCTDEATGTSFPALNFSTSANIAPYVAADASTQTFAGATRSIKEFWLMGQNFIYSRFGLGSLVATRLSPRDRLIKLRTVVPYDSDHSNLYGQALAGATATLAFTNGAYSTTFTFGTLQVPADSPFVRGKTEIDLTLDMVARKTGSTASLVVTNVSS